MGFLFNGSYIIKKKLKKKGWKWREETIELDSFNNLLVFAENLVYT